MSTEPKREFTKAELTELANEFLKKHHEFNGASDVRMRDIGLFYAFFCDIFDAKDSESGKGGGVNL